MVKIFYSFPDKVTALAEVAISLDLRHFLCRLQCGLRWVFFRGMVHPIQHLKRFFVLFPNDDLQVTMHPTNPAVDATDGGSHFILRFLKIVQRVDDIMTDDEKRDSQSDHASISYGW